MRVALASDHGGFDIKRQLAYDLSHWGHEVVDFGPAGFDPDDDFPDFIIPMAEAVAGGKVERGVAVCGSGVGASIAAGKVRGARAALVHDCFSARQGVEDDDMNILCMGGGVVGYSLAAEVVRAFLTASFAGRERHRRRLAKIGELDRPG